MVRTVPILTLCALLVIAGCSGISPGQGDDPQTSAPTDGTQPDESVSRTSAIDCSPTVPTDIDVTDMLPRESDRWQIMELYDGIPTPEPQTTTEASFSVKLDISLGTDEAASGMYRGPDGEKYLVMVGRYSNRDTAAQAIPNASLLFPMAVKGHYGAMAVGNNRNHSKELLSQMPCIQESDVVVPELNFSAGNATNVSDHFINRTASISSIEHSIRTDSFGPYLEATVRGTSDNATLRVEFLDPSGETVDKTHLTRDTLSDGAEAVSLDLPDEYAAGEYTIRISQFTTDEVLHEEPVTIERPELNIESWDIDLEEQSYSSQYKVTRMEVTVSNTGMMPVSLSEIAIIMNGDERNMYLNSERLDPGETATFSSEDYSIILPYIEGSRSTIRIVARSDSRPLAEHEDTLDPDSESG